MSSDKGPVVIQSTLDYKAKPISTSQYAFTRLLPLSGGQSQTVGVGATQEVLFEIPSKVINLAQTVISYQMQIPAQGAGNFAWVPMDTYGEIQQIQLMPRGGAPIADVLYANNYMKMARKTYTNKLEYDEMIAEDGLFRSNLPAPQNPSAAPAIYQAAGAAGGTSVTASLAQTEPQYLQVSQAANAVWPVAAGTQLRQLKLGYLKNTIFESDFDIYFPQTMILRVVFSGSKVGWLGTSSVNPATGAAPLTGNITMSVLSVYLQVEQREQIIREVMAKALKGWSLPIPYLWYAKVPLTGASQAVSIRMTGSNGKFCRKIYIAPFAPNETNNYIFDHSNVIGSAGAVTSGGKLASFYTNLDNSRMQQFDISCVPTSTTGANTGSYNSDDYLLQKHMLNGSVIQNKPMYQLNWVWQQDFLGDQSPLDPSLRGNLLGGLDLSGSSERKYDFYAQTVQSDSTPATMALNWYVFYVCTRILHISPTQVFVE